MSRVLRRDTRGESCQPHHPARDYQSGWSQWSGQVDLDEFNDRVAAAVTWPGGNSSRSAHDQPEKLFRKVGYCSQFDSFPGGMTGREFISAFLKVSGFSRSRLMIFPKSLWSVSICSRQLIVKIGEHTAKACVSGFDWRNRSHTNLRF